MADLTKTLPTEMSGKETVVPRAPAGSPLGILADGTSTVVKAYGDYRRQREEEKAKQGKIDAENDAARAAGIELTAPYFEAPDAGATAAQQSAAQIAPELQKLDKASAQGRGAGLHATRVRSAALIRQALAAHPGYEAVVMKTLKDYGIVDRTVAEYDAAAAAVTREEVAAADREKEIANNALELGYDWDNLDGAQQTSVRKEVLQYMRSKAVLEVANTEADWQAKRATMGRDAADRAEKEDGYARVQAMLDTFGPQLDAFSRGIEQIAMDPTIPPEQLDGKMSEYLRVFQIEMPRRFTNMMSLYGTRMTSEQRTMVKEQWERYMNMGKDFLTGPYSVVEQNKRQVSILQNALDLSMDKAMPVWHSMRQLLGSQALGTIMGNQILNDSKVKEKLALEWKNVDLTNPGETRVHIQNLMRVLHGEDIKTFPPQEVKAMAPKVIGSMADMARNPAIAKGVDEESHRNLTNAIGAAATLAVDANVQWGGGNLLANLNAFTDSGVVTALVGTQVNREERTTAINQYQPAVQQLTQTLAKVNMGDKYYNLKWDKNRHQYVAEWNGKMAKDTSSLGAADPRVPGVSPMMKPAPSRAITNQVNALNKAISIQSNLAAKGWDPTMPKTVSDAERREFYGRGVIPSSIREKNSKEKTSTGIENLDRMFEELKNSINSSGPYIKGDISERIVAVEKKPGDPAYVNPASGVQGDGQFSEGTWLSTIRKHRPDLVEGKSQQEILDLRADPEISKEMTAAHASDNREALSAANLPAGDGEVYLAHFLGLGGAKKVLSAAIKDPEQALANFVDPEVFTDNPFLKEKGITTVGAIIDWARGKMGV